jgi:MFS family permease
MSNALSSTLDAGRQSWYSGLAPNEKRTFWACFGGWALDAFDVQIFSFAIPAIVATFSITNVDAGFIGTVTLLTSAFGGWVAGILADRYERVRTLQITIAWFAAFTFLSGFAQTYHQLLICRALMGFGFSGEWAAGAVLMGEVIRTRHRGKAVGMVQSGWPIGWGVAAILSTILFSLLQQETAWRVLFWIGLMPALMVLFVRRFVDEPPLFKAAREKIATGAHRQGWLEIFSPEIIKTTS